MDILGMLTDQLGGDALGQISRQHGTDEKTAGNATAAGVSALIGALSRNAGKADVASALDSALAKYHDGNVLEVVRSSNDVSMYQLVDSDGVLCGHGEPI